MTTLFLIILSLCTAPLIVGLWCYLWRNYFGNVAELADASANEESGWQSHYLSRREGSSPSVATISSLLFPENPFLGRPAPVVADSPEVPAVRPHGVAIGWNINKRKAGHSLSEGRAA